VVCDTTVVRMTEVTPIKVSPWYTNRFKMNWSENEYESKYQASLIE